MPPRSVAIPSLRLVNILDAGAHPPLPSSDAVGRARRQIAAENHSASSMSVDDARWAFAVTVSQSLEGGRTAALPPASRDRLLKVATRMGMRPFDANLVIAIVQDGARSGEGSLAAPVAGRLMLVRPPAAEAGASIWPQVMAVAALAAAMGAALVRWVSAG